jgi:hypothetical protein
MGCPQLQILVVKDNNVSSAQNWTGGGARADFSEVSVENDQNVRSARDCTGSGGVHGRWWCALEVVVCRKHNITLSFKRIATVMCTKFPHHSADVFRLVEVVPPGTGMQTNGDTRQFYNDTFLPRLQVTSYLFSFRPLNLNPGSRAPVSQSMRR